MAGTNDFQTFAEGGSSNTLTPTAYAALTTLLANGYQTGVASSQQINTTLRQAAYASAALAGIISDAGFDALDNGDLTTFKANLLKAMSIPVGTLFDFGGSAAPSGFLLCNGAAISRTTYAALFAVVGTTFGAGNGSTTFNLPDARNRTRVGSGGLYAIGGTGGSKDAIVVSHNHSIFDSGHNHSVNDPGHSHVYKGTSYPLDSDNGGGPNTMHGPTDTPTTSSTTGISLNASGTGISVNTTGSSGTDNNMMPYFACPLIIKY